MCIFERAGTCMCAHAVQKILFQMFTIGVCMSPIPSDHPSESFAPIYYPFLLLPHFINPLVSTRLCIIHANSVHENTSSRAGHVRFITLGRIKENQFFLATPPKTHSILHQIIWEYLTEKCYWRLLTKVSLNFVQIYSRSFDKNLQLNSNRNFRKKFYIQENKIKFF